MARVDRWSWTLNNPGEFKPHWDPQEMHYMVYQLEEGENHTPHYQGYTRFRTRKVLATAKNLIHQGAHLAPSEGSEEHNRDYCTKEKGRIAVGAEYGTYDPTKGKKGKRTDLDAVTATIKTGAPLSVVIDTHMEMYIKYSTGMEKAVLAMEMKTAPVRRDVHTTVLWGPTGTGKTHRVRTMYGLGVFIVKPGRDPWGGYNSQDVICFDEFDWMKWSIHDMKQFLDVWGIELDRRYCNKLARYTRVYIIANQPPEDWYAADRSADKEAFMRRLTEPMGAIFQVLSQDQELDMEWWVTKPAPTPVIPIAAMAPAAIMDGTPQPLRRSDDWPSVDLSSLNQ